MSLTLNTLKITSPKSGTNCFKNQASFLAWESRSRDTIEVKRCYVDVAGGDLIAGILLTGLTQLAQNVGGASLHHAVIQIRPNTYERLGVLVAELNN